MLRVLLSPSQREALFHIPGDISEQALVQRYTFSAVDLALIKAQREGHNRLGFAVQLAYLRFPGRPLQAGEEASASLLGYIAAQLHLSPLVFRRYAKRDTTRRQHARKIQRYLQLHQLTRKDEHVLQTLLLPVALQTGSNIAIVTALLEHMRQRKFTIPAVSTVEKLAYVIQEEGRRILFSELTSHLSAAQKEKLDCLLSLRDRTQTHLVWLKNFPRRPTPQGVLSVLDRIDYIDSVHLPPRSSNLYENRITRLAREGMRHTPQYIERLDVHRRHGLLVAIVSELRRDLIDQAILMHDKMMGQFFNRLEWQQKEAFHKRGKAINEKVRLYARIGKALIRAKESNANWEEAIASVIPWEKYRASVVEAETLVMGENFDFLDRLRSRYSYLRQYVPRLLSTLPIQATPAGQPLLAALNLLKALNATGKRAIPVEAPTEFITQRWAPYIFTGRKLDRQYYELHALADLRNQFRCGDLYVAGSRTHKEFDTYVLSPVDWERVKASGQTGLAVPIDWHTYIAQQSALLHQRLTHINRQIGRSRLPEVTLTNGRLHIAQPEKSVPEAALTLAQRAYSLVPPVKLTDLLVEVDSWTHFSDCFTRDDDPTKGVKERDVLYSAVLADAINLGLLQMAQVTPGISLNQLAWMSDYYLREETYQKALSKIIKEHSPEEAGIDITLLAHISPIEWSNVILYGEYKLNKELVR
jgi:TnpA family transposase